MNVRGDRLPPPSEAGDLAVAISRLVRGVIDLPYLGKAGEEIQTDDVRLSRGIVQNPVKAAHEIAGIYLNAAGELLHTLGAVLQQGRVQGRASQPEAPPYVSTAPLARASLEHAAKSWWLQQPSDTGRRRTGRALGAMRGDFDVTDPGESGDSWGQVGVELEQWATRQPFKVVRGQSKITDVLRQMDPPYGELHFEYLSEVVHGGPTSILRIFAQTQAGPEFAFLDQWSRTLIATRAVANASRAVANLRGAELGPPWPDVIALHDYYGGLLEAEYAAAAPNERPGPEHRPDGGDKKAQ